MPTTSSSNRNMSEQLAKLLLISIIAAVCFHFPIIQLPSQKKLIAGVPSLYLFIFLVWLGIIFATAWVLYNSPKEKEDKEE